MHKHLWRNKKRDLRNAVCLSEPCPEASGQRAEGESVSHSVSQDFTADLRANKATLTAYVFLPLCVRMYIHTSKHAFVL